MPGVLLFSIGPNGCVRPAAGVKYRHDAPVCRPRLVNALNGYGTGNGDVDHTARPHGRRELPRALARGRNTRLKTMMKNRTFKNDSGQRKRLAINIF